MASRSQKIKLGIFLAVSTGLLILVIVLFAGLSLLKPVKSYRIHFPDSVSGLQIGAKVKLNGVDVGSVSRVEVDPDNVEHVRVTVQMDSDAPVKVDSQAFLILQGITGLKYIDIRSGTRNAQVLEPGGSIIAGKDTIAKVMDRADDILDNIERITSEQNVQRIISILEKLDLAVTSIDKMAAEFAAISATLHNHLKNNPKSVDQLVANLGPLSSRLKDAVLSATGLFVALDRKTRDLDLKTTVAGLNQTNQRIQTLLDSAASENLVAEVVAAVRSSQRTLDELAKLVGENRQQITTATLNLQLASESLKQFASTIEQKPNAILFSETPPPRHIP